MIQLLQKGYGWQCVGTAGAIGLADLKFREEGVKGIGIAACFGIFSLLSDCVPIITFHCVKSRRFTRLAVWSDCLAMCSWCCASGLCGWSRATWVQTMRLCLAVETCELRRLISAWRPANQGLPPWASVNPKTSADVVVSKDAISSHVWQGVLVWSLLVMAWWNCIRSAMACWDLPRPLYVSGRGGSLRCPKMPFGGANLMVISTGLWSV